MMMACRLHVFILVFTREETESLRVALLIVSDAGIYHLKISLPS